MKFDNCMKIFSSFEGRSEKAQTQPSGSLSSKSSRDLAQETVSSQNETTWRINTDSVEESQSDRMMRSVRQQATRDYHSHLSEGWWDRI